MPDANVIALVEDGFEDLELVYPVLRLGEDGYVVEIATPDGADRCGDNGYAVDADVEVAEVDPHDYDALLLPGGYQSVDSLRLDDESTKLVRRFAVDTDKPVFAIGYGPVMLIEADALGGVELTSFPSLRKDLENAGAIWSDEPVVRSGRFVTSRNLIDIAPFTRAMVDALKEHGTEPAVEEAASPTT